MVYVETVTYIHVQYIGIYKRTYNIIFTHNYNKTVCYSFTLVFLFKVLKYTIIIIIIIIIIESVDSISRDERDFH